MSDDKTLVQLAIADLFLDELEAAAEGAKDGGVAVAKRFTAMLKAGTLEIEEVDEDDPDDTVIREVDLPHLPDVVQILSNAVEAVVKADGGVLECIETRREALIELMQPQPSAKGGASAAPSCEKPKAPAAAAGGGGGGGGGVGGASARASSSEPASDESTPAGDDAPGTSRQPGAKAKAAQAGARMAAAALSAKLKEKKATMDTKDNVAKSEEAAKAAAAKWQAAAKEKQATLSSENADMRKKLKEVKSRLFSK